MNKKIDWNKYQAHICVFAIIVVFSLLDTESARANQQILGYIEYAGRRITNISHIGIYAFALIDLMRQNDNSLKTFSKSIIKLALTSMLVCLGIMMYKQSTDDALIASYVLGSMGGLAMGALVCMFIFGEPNIKNRRK